MAAEATEEDPAAGQLCDLSQLRRSALALHGPILRLVEGDGSLGCSVGNELNFVVIG